MKTLDVQRSITDKLMRQEARRQELILMLLAAFAIISFVCTVVSDATAKDEPPCIKKEQLQEAAIFINTGEKPVRFCR